MATKTIIVTKTRTLADGTKKQYITKQTYKVKRTADKKLSRTGKLTEEQINEIWVKYNADVKKKVLCVEYNVSYITLKKAIDSKRPK